MKKIVAYEIVSHGVEHEQYFQGCGVAFTKYDECYTGIGDSEKAALEDAIEQAVCSECIFPSELTAEIDGLVNEADTRTTESVDDDVHYYVSIRLKAEDVRGDGHCTACGNYAYVSDGNGLCDHCRASEGEDPRAGLKGKE
jgi:hypothetical protein